MLLNCKRIVANTFSADDRGIFADLSKPVRVDFGLAIFWQGDDQPFGAFHGAGVDTVEAVEIGGMTQGGAKDGVAGGGGY